MKKIHFFTVFSFFALLFQFSCVSVENKKDVKIYALKIVLSEKLDGMPGDKLPADLDSILLPIEPASCPKIALVPDAEIIRLGLPKEYRRKIEIDKQNWKSFFQKFYGNTNSLTRKKNITDALNKITIGDTLLLKNAANIDLTAAFEKMVESNPGALFVIYKAGYSQSQFVVGKSSIPVYSSIDTLITRVGLKLCEKAASPDKKTIIIYDPVIVEEVAVIPEEKPIENPAVSTAQNTKVEPNPVKPVKPTTVTTTPAVQGTTTIERGKTITFPNGDVYVGEVKNGQPEGNGVLTFKNKRVISELQSLKQTAEAGDYIVGVWREGELQTGSVYNSAKVYRFTYSIGG